MAGMLRVADAMTKDVRVVREDTNMQEVVHTMTKFDISSIVVVQKDRPIGLITHKDVIIKVLEQDFVTSALTARHVMSAPVTTISEDATIEEAAKMMASKGYKKLIVVRNGSLVGIITTTDIVRQQPKLVELFEDLLRPCVKP
jgi:CBS domain-containing protein